ncbi:MAG: YbaB/EbfC family nucleoid-associated protein [Eggerthellaceae bacterium]|nr:YbaB/EbfC family nucleoid-associated protein [Eggerthellaceae bacterium]
MNMKKMMKQAQQMHRDMQIAQAQLRDDEFKASSGGGMVKVVVTGDMEVKSIEIGQNAMDIGDSEILSDMVMAAVNEALRGMKEIANKKMGAITGGANFPSLM